VKIAEKKRNGSLMLSMSKSPECLYEPGFAGLMDESVERKRVHIHFMDKSDYPVVSGHLHGCVSRGRGWLRQAQPPGENEKSARITHFENSTIIRITGSDNRSRMHL
jgi:hypothetical protein